MQSASDEIKASILEQPSWIVHDVKTFQYLRWNKHDLIKSEKLGGGNLLSLIGLFSVINYLSKVYKILKTGSLQAIEKKANKNKFFTEDRAFKSLVLDSPIKFIENQDDKNLSKIWKLFRNIPSHTAQIPKGSGAYVLINDANDIPNDLLEELVKNYTDKSFTIVSDRGFICLIDKLILDVDDLITWVIEDIDNKYQNKSISIANKWIKKNSLG